MKIKHGGPVRYAIAYRSTYDAGQRVVFLSARTPGAAKRNFRSDPLTRLVGRATLYLASEFRLQRNPDPRGLVMRQFVFVYATGKRNHTSVVWAYSQADAVVAFTDSQPETVAWVLLGAI